MRTIGLHSLGIFLREFDLELPEHGFRREYRSGYDEGGAAIRLSDSWQYSRSINTSDGRFGAWICVRIPDTGHRFVVNKIFPGGAFDGLTNPQRSLAKLWMDTRVREVQAI